MSLGTEALPLSALCLRGLLSRSYCPSPGAIQNPEAARGKASPNPAIHQPLKRQGKPDPLVPSMGRGALHAARPPGWQEEGPPAQSGGPRGLGREQHGPPPSQGGG